MAADGRPVFHALGLRFALPGGEEWRMAVDHTPIFIVSTPADFVALQKASVPDPATGKPDPDQIRLTAKIDVSDLDLSTPAGIRAAHERLHEAAGKVCTHAADSSAPSQKASFDTCVEDIVTNS